jgi:mRNA-degrading endonuclease RelE of RelBE toxin-antitoxin system
MKFEALAEFKVDVKSLIKKYRTLEDDLAVVKKVLQVLPDERPPFSFQIDNLGLQTCIIKVRKMACKALKGKGNRSGIRIIYAFYPEKFVVEFLEIYFKEKDDSDMDYEFIKKYLDNNQNDV